MAGDEVAGRSLYGQMHAPPPDTMMVTRSKSSQHVLDAKKPVLTHAKTMGLLWATRKGGDTDASSHRNDRKTTKSFHHGKHKVIPYAPERLSISQSVKTLEQVEAMVAATATAHIEPKVIIIVHRCIQHAYYHDYHQIHREIIYR
jgi:hypothetical protein